MPGLLAMFTNKKSLDADLKRVTESGVIEVPQALLQPVLDAAHSEDDRREIMRHLQSCLAEPSGKHWKRVHAALVLAEALVLKGPSELLTETSQGRHFDLVQRLALWESFEYETDRRIQNSLRTKAKALRRELVPRLQDASDKCDSLTDTESTGSVGAMSRLTSSTGSEGALGGALDDGCTHFSSDSPPALPQRPLGQMILNGIATVGHHDDTTSESDNDDGPRKVVQFRARGQASNKALRHQTSAKAPAVGLGAMSVLSSSTGDEAALGGAVENEGTHFSCDAPPTMPERPVGQMILNGIVTVGHHDDTTSESDNDDGPQKAVQFKRSRQAAIRASRRQTSAKH